MTIYSLYIYSRNNLATLPHELCSLSSLSLLKLDYNKLTQLPDEFGKLVKLEELDISHNALTNLPESIGELTCLSRLTASHNQLKKLPDTIGTMAGINAGMCYVPTNNPPPSPLSPPFLYFVCILCSIKRPYSEQQ